MSSTPRRPPMRLLDDRRKALDSEGMAQFLGGADLSRGDTPPGAAPAPATPAPMPVPAPVAEPEPVATPPAPVASAPVVPAVSAPAPVASAPAPAPVAAPSAGAAYTIPRKQHPRHKPQAGTAVRVRGGRLEVEGPLPWETMSDGQVPRSFTLRLSAEELEKLRFVSACIPGMSIQRFVHEATMDAIERVLEELLGGRG